MYEEVFPLKYKSKKLLFRNSERPEQNCSKVNLPFLRNIDLLKLLKDQEKIYRELS